MSSAPRFLEHDRIRDESWFQAMPVEHRMRVLRERELDRERQTRAEARQRKAQRHVLVEAGLLFLAAQVVLTGFSWSSVLLAPLVGVGVGILWVLTRAGILLSPLIAMPAYLLLQFVFARGQMQGLMLVIGVFPLGLISAYLGSRREVASYE